MLKAAEHGATSSPSWPHIQLLSDVLQLQTRKHPKKPMMDKMGFQSLSNIYNEFYIT